ncbi:unnamed protein product, partial [Meganyctiphanes norvegica]
RVSAVHLCKMIRRAVFGVMRHRQLEKSYKFTNASNIIKISASKLQLLKRDEPTYDISRISRYYSTTNEPSKLSELPEEFDRRALMELEVDLLRQEGHTVPSVLTDTQWDDLSALPSRSRRRKFLRFLALNEFKRENAKKKKEERSLRFKAQQEQLEAEKEEEKKNKDPNEIYMEYGLGKNTLYFRIYDTAINHFRHGRLMDAMLWGQSLIIDMDFNEHMNVREQQNTGDQIQELFGDNRRHKSPFDLQLYNMSKDSVPYQRLLRMIPVLEKPSFPLTIMEHNYLHDFPKEQLVYLTPDAREEMIKFDHNATYIIGGIVDRSDSEPLTLAKAKREGLRVQKLPLDRYLHWGMGGKSLTLNQIINILLDIKESGNWEYALRHVPKRKVKNEEEKIQAILRREQKIMKLRNPNKKFYQSKGRFKGIIEKD